jgi:hypothetical protein
MQAEINTLGVINVPNDTTAGGTADMGSVVVTEKPFQLA